MIMRLCLPFVALAALLAARAEGFVAPRRGARASSALRMAAEVSVTLPKPLGIILEENGEKKTDAMGVKVVDIDPEGSAAGSGKVEVGMVLKSVDGFDVTRVPFDAVMNVVIDAESPVELCFLPVGVEVDAAAPAAAPAAPAAEEAEEVEGPPAPAEEAPAAPTGPVRVVVVDGSEESSFEVEADFILRKELLANKASLNDMMGKITNCNGAGQCGTCKVELLAGEESCTPRTAAEEQKLRGKPASWRLACQTVVETPGAELKVRVKP